MKKQIALITLIAAALAAGSISSRAQEAGNSSTNSAATPKKHSGTPFHGKATVDTAAMTLTVGSLTLNVTSATKITKDGKPATLSDITTGETVGGSYKKDTEGKLTATTIHAGEKNKKASQ